MTALRTAYLRHTIASCNEIEVEVTRVLKLRFGWKPEDAVSIMRSFLGRGVLVQIAGTLTNVCRDTNDDMVVECALLAEADFIVSGDKDLLTLKAYSGISILTARAFLDLLEDF
jgi:uncharacterized protein